jgi:YidC/Oxa1 family membrane protein insertase
MDKRLGLALGISMAILFVWWKLFPPQQPPPAPPTPPAQTAPAQPAPAQPAPAAPAPTATGSADAPAPTPPVNAAEQRITLETPKARFVLSSWGGTLRELHLKDPKYRIKEKRPSGEEVEKELQLIGTTTPQAAPLLTTFTSNDFSLQGHAPYAVTRPGKDRVVFTAESNGVVVEKAYSLEASGYRLKLEVSVRNKREKAVNHSLTLHLFGKQDPEKKGSSFLDYASANLTEMVCFINDKAERHNVEDLSKEPKEFLGTVRWMAADEKFVTLAAVPHPDLLGSAQKCRQRALDPLTGEVFLPLSSKSLGPGEVASYSFDVFGGPKYREELELVRPGGQDPQLVEVVNVTFAFLSKPLLALLKFFHRFTDNWGLAIILLTVFVRLVTFYPQQRTMMSAKKMQKLAPKMAAIRKKYENDRQRMGVETMNLYKAHGVSPLGGCLPALIQMPIWMALFSTLNYAVELHRSSFLYIDDLSAKDPLYLMPLLMGAVMFLQMRMSPAGADPQQQKMMAIMMPIMFTVFSLFLPAGLSVYTLTSYVIGILQQLLVNYLDRRNERGSAPAKAT